MQCEILIFILKLGDSTTTSHLRVLMSSETHLGDARALGMLIYCCATKNYHQIRHGADRKFLS